MIRKSESLAEEQNGSSGRSRDAVASALRLDTRTTVFSRTSVATEPRSVDAGLVQEADSANLKYSAKLSVL